MKKDFYINELNSYVGVREGTPRHSLIINMYNMIRPKPRQYYMKTNDAWCAAFLSAIAWDAGGGAWKDFPYECSVAKMMQKAIDNKMWIEDESITPREGWLCVYDWEGEQGHPDHVGCVIRVSKKQFKVIEGNYQNAVKVRTMKPGDVRIRGYVALKYDKPTNDKVDVKTLANQVIRGLWSTGKKRRDMLKAAGHDPDAVQAEVNKILKK